MITLQGFSDYLYIDFPDDNQLLQNCLNSAIAVIEEYTQHSLTAQTETYISEGCDIQIYKAPITDIVADDDFKRYNKSDSVIISAPLGTEINVTFGVSNKKQLVNAVYQLAAYYYENREPDSGVIPNTIQLTINQLRRGLF